MARPRPSARVLSKNAVSPTAMAVTIESESRTHAVAEAPVNSAAPAVASTQRTRIVPPIVERIALIPAEPIPGMSERARMLVTAHISAEPSDARAPRVVSAISASLARQLDERRHVHHALDFLRVADEPVDLRLAVDEPGQDDVAGDHGDLYLRALELTVGDDLRFDLGADRDVARGGGPFGYQVGLDALDALDLLRDRDAPLGDLRVGDAGQHDDTPVAEHVERHRVLHPDVE